MGSGLMRWDTADGKDRLSIALAIANCYGRKYSAKT